MGTKKVIFVNEGGWGDFSASNGDYDKIIASFSKKLEKMTQPAAVVSEREKVATAVTVKSTDEAIQMMEQEDIDSLVFFSRSMISKAREVKKSYPRTRVVVFTGLIPDDEVIIASKGWIGLDSDALFKEIIVG